MSKGYKRHPFCGLKFLYIFNNSQNKGIVGLFMLGIAAEFGSKHDFFFCREVYLYVVDRLTNNLLKISAFRGFIAYNMVVHVINQI